jgi:hypothetical protein
MLNQNLKHLLLSASANALKVSYNTYDQSISYLELYIQSKRALPTELCVYKHSLLLYKVMREEQPKRDWIDLNFQMINTRRQLSFETRNTSNYKVGNIILSNRLSSLNKKIQLQDLSLPFESYKIKCKMMFFKSILNVCFARKSIKPSKVVCIDTHKGAGEGEGGPNVPLQKT